MKINRIIEKFQLDIYSSIREVTTEKKLLDQVRDVIRMKHYSLKTEKAYIYWIRRYILFHNKKTSANNVGK